ncbi:sigma-54 interaction domain-containing protein [Cytobacillus firmus]|uniref:sigma-54 interaction domain-containing protein n=1 Tax=Cytobacillus firmus TaxID=1399 RepID=UPI0018CDA453|nr:sigma 54-interacting transcriptional regulator [Cytobacillus firmus]MBG9444745.1 RNA polymerase subunit sigma-54 [Cytobacillus firmus]URT71823.1 sigma 54-interacting transcriptional regulator [Cytobacillus firmus]
MNSFFMDWNNDREVISSMEEDIMVTNADGIIIKVSKGSGVHYGIEPDTLLGESVYELERRGVFKPAITPEVLKKKKKVILVQKAGSGKKILVTGIPVFNETGNIDHIVSYSYDVSELLVIKEYLNSVEEEMARVKSELDLLRNKSIKMDGMVADSTAMRNIAETIRRIRDVDVTVLLLGESGVGKSALAKWIHQNSTRKAGPFIEVNCSAIPESIFEAEFFGYEGGAFTGAKNKGKMGFAEMAKGGTLFLDEIGELSAHLQAKLLKFIQDKQFYRVGGTKPVHADFRLLAATNKDLEKAVESRDFRQDLFFRLNVVPLKIPPLRERKEDLFALIHYFLHSISKRHNRERHLDKSLVDHLLQLEWKGNVRELENLMERLIVTSTSLMITKDDLPYEYHMQGKKEGFIDYEGHTLPAILEDVEKKVLINARKRYRTTTEIAGALGISQPSVVRKLKKYDC